MKLAQKLTAHRVAAADFVVTAAAVHVGSLDRLQLK
jgi:hypothetical protein